MQAKQTTAAIQQPHLNPTLSYEPHFNHGNVAVNHPNGQGTTQHPHTPSYTNNVAHFSYNSINQHVADGHANNASYPTRTSSAGIISEYRWMEETSVRMGSRLPSIAEITRNLESCEPLPHRRTPVPMVQRCDGFEVHRSSHLRQVVPASDHLSVQPALTSTPTVVHRPQPSTHGFPTTAVRSSGSIVSPAANTHETNIMHHYSVGTSQGAPLPPIRSLNNGFNEAVISPVNADPVTREDGSVVCSECSEEYGNMQSWRRHAARAHPFEGVRMIPCRECRVQFRNHGNLRRHMRTAHAQIPGHVQCHLCTATFTSQRACSLHIMRIHTTVTTVSGVAQGRVARRQRTSAQLGTRAGANQHSSRSNPASGVYKCPACDYVSKWKGNISRHYDSVHLKLLSHSCDLCDRRFNTSSNLAVHRITHQHENG